MTNHDDDEKEIIRNECLDLLQWVLLEIRYICGYKCTETVLTTGEQAWIWALADLSHNIPRLFGNEFSNCLPFSKLDELKQLKRLYINHCKDITNHHAEGWTKEKIYSLIFPLEETPGTPETAGRHRTQTRTNESRKNKKTKERMEDLDRKRNLIEGSLP